MEKQKWGDYELLGTIGKGAQGVVYKAMQPLLARTVAIKVLPAYYAGDDSFVTRFQREAQNIARLSHPNIVQVYDMNKFEGTYYYVMEYIEGEDLGKMMKRGVQFSWEQIIDIIKQVASALEAAAEQNMVHRDIKPENIMITLKGQVKVADFGLAKITGSDANATKSGIILGTVNYMPPEQAKGGECDVRSDLYSLGVVMFRMLTGELPFNGENIHTVLYKHINEQPPNPRTINPAVPEHLSNICLKLLNKEPERRFQRPVELMHVLDAVLGASSGSLAATRTIEVGGLPAETSLRSQSISNLGPDGPTITLRPDAKGAGPQRRKAPVAIVATLGVLVLLLVVFGAERLFLGGSVTNKLFPFLAGSGTSVSPSPSPSAPKTEYIVKFAISPSEATVEVQQGPESRELLPKASADGTTTHSFAPGTYQIAAFCDGYIPSGETVFVVKPDGTVIPEEVAVSLKPTPEREAELAVSAKLKNLLGPDALLEYLPELEKQALAFPGNAVIKQGLEATQNKLKEHASSLCTQARDLMNTQAEMLENASLESLEKISLSRDEELLKESLKFWQSDEAKKTQESLGILREAISEYVSLAKLEKANEGVPAQLPDIIAKYSAFIEKYGQTLASPLVSMAAQRKVQLGGKMSNREKYEAWLLGVKNYVDEVKKAIALPDFEVAQKFLEKAKQELANQPADVKLQPDDELIKTSKALSDEVNTALPPVVAKGLRNRDKEVWPVIEQFTEAMKKRDLTVLAELLSASQEKEKYLSELKDFLAYSEISTAGVQRKPQGVCKVENDMAEYQLVWSIDLRISALGAQETAMTERVELVVKLKFVDKTWRIDSLAVTGAWSDIKENK
ncbi:MAG: serine/threonine-protein kinase [Candidatus Brocadiia bacterium]